MHSMRKMGKAVTAFGLALLLGVPASADWSRNFNDAFIAEGGLYVADSSGVPLVNVDLSVLGTPPGELMPSIVPTPSIPNDRSLHLEFAGGAGTSGGDSGLLLDPRPQATNITAKMLVRLGDNPDAGNGEKLSINAGFVLHVDQQFNGGYICVTDDSGYLQLQRIDQGAINNFPEPESRKHLSPFDVAANWWLRFELRLEADGMHVNARMWLDGTPEPDMCAWDVQAIDPNPIMGGLSAIAVNEDANIAGGTNWINIDNVSVSSQVACVELCENYVDDNGNGLIDCEDPGCSSQPTCLCNTPFADMDGDNDVDQDDFGVFQTCFTGADDPAQAFDTQRCACLDRDEINNDGKFTKRVDGNQAIDRADYDVFVRCISGPNIPASPDCEGPR